MSLIRKVYQATAIVGFCVAAAGYFLDRNIVTRQMLAAEGEYNYPVMIKGRTFYATHDEVFYHNTILYLFFILLFLGVFCFGVIKFRGKD